MTNGTMGRSVTSVVSESDDFQAAMDTEGAASLVVTGPGRFRVRLTRIALDHLRLAAVEESLPRIALITVPADKVLIAFLLGNEGSQAWGGISAQAGELITVQPGQAVHSRSDGPCRWGGIWFPAGEFTRYSTALHGKPLVLTGVVCLWRPSLSASGRLHRLHSVAIRAAHTRWETLTVAEAAHGLEQQLIHALFECMVTPASNETAAIRRDQDLAVRFEDLLRRRPYGDLAMPVICGALGVSDRALRRCCEHQLGMSPMRYLRLHRMQSAHRALRQGVPEAIRVSDVAKRYGFGSPGRFAGAYRELFGELPSWTLRRDSRRRVRGQWHPAS
jgi:AraC-like DNA-binding protein